MTYGDGLADVDIPALQAFHQFIGEFATVTTVQPVSRFGLMDVAEDGVVTEFREAPAGCLGECRVLRLRAGCAQLPGGRQDASGRAIQELAAAGRLAAYRHLGFWQPMDTYRESQVLNDLWSMGKAPWRIW